jgi:hypothetical protein
MNNVSAFLTADAHRLPILKPFDVVDLSDLVNDLWDVQEILAQVGTRIAGKRISPHEQLKLVSLSLRLWIRERLS